MADITQEQVIGFLSELNVLQLGELVKTLEDQWGVSAAAAVPMAMAMPGAGAAAEVEEQTEFTVVLTSFGAKKIQVIKEVRAITGLGLKEAKDLVEGVPSDVKEDISKDEAKQIAEKIENAGGVVEIK